MERSRALWLALSLAAAGCHAGAAPLARTIARTPGAAVIGEVRSNVLRGDYAGSLACARCHPAIFKAWAESPMHQMTRLPAAAHLEAPFDGSEFHFKDDSVRLETHDGLHYMRLQSPQYGAKLFRVTKVIGGHHREDFAGVEVNEGAPGLPPLGDPHTERVLPVSFMLATRSYRYKGYSVMVRERPGIRPGGVWNKTCVFCHNTVPLLSTLFGALAGPGTKPYQGEVVDPLLPPERRAVYEVTDAQALGRAAEAEVALLEVGGGGGGAARAGEGAVERAIRVTRARFNETHLLELGIGCESCHGGSREHVEHVGLSPSYEPRAEFLRVRAPSSSHAAEVNRVCARCHQVLFSRYPFTWEGGLRANGPGGSHINSGEARDFLLGACAGEMSCVTCHDPHAPDNRRSMIEMEGLAGNRICLGCHEHLSGEVALAAHSHHRANGAGAVCMNCHMPRKNMSLDTRLTRYHRIGSPTDVARVERDRPLECALCHADKTVGELVGAMESWWSKKYQRARLTALYGDLDAKVLSAALKLGKPHEQATAMAALGEGGVRDAAPLIAAQLTHEYPILRFYARAALEKLMGRPYPGDLHQDDAKIRADAAQWLGEAGFSPAAPLPAAPSRATGVESGED